MLKRSSLKQSRLFCPITRSFDDLSFSLVDYKNNYFTSNDPIKIIEFYDGFENREQLIQWMEERPKGVANIFEVEGSNEIIVVIPTSDFNGKYAKECRENIFTGLHIIFVESGGREDFYFNYAHNCNVGIMKAMEYNPKWIVVSNDDKYKINDIQILSNELSKRNGCHELLFPGFFPKSSYEHSLNKLNLIGGIILAILGRKFLARKKGRSMKIAIINRFKIRVNTGFNKYIDNRLFTKKIRKYQGDMEMLIYSRYIFENYGNILFLDEKYINGVEDQDLLLRFSLHNIRTEKIEFKIGLYYNSSLGSSESRHFRDLANIIYFDEKWRSKEYRFKENRLG